jgi:hypothetical protein
MKQQDLSELERGIAREIQQVISEEGRAAPVPDRGARVMRDMVRHEPALVTIPLQPHEHKKGVLDVGMLSAEAVTQEFETVAQEVESLGRDLSDVAQRCVEMVTGIHALIEEVRSTAQHCRAEGTKLSKQVEACTKAADDVREQLKGARRKLGITNGI